MNTYAKIFSLRNLGLPLVRSQKLFENPTDSRYLPFTSFFGEKRLNRGVSWKYAVNIPMLASESQDTPMVFQLLAQHQEARRQAKYWRKAYFKLKNQNGGHYNG